MVATCFEMQLRQVPGVSGSRSTAWSCGRLAPRQSPSVTARGCHCKGHEVQLRWTFLTPHSLAVEMVLPPELLLTTVCYWLVISNTVFVVSIFEP